MSVEKITEDLKKKKTGFWVMIGAAVLFIVGSLALIFSGGKYSVLLERAFEIFGRTKEHDKDAEEAIKKAEEQKKKNEEEAKKAKEEAEKAAKDTEEFKKKVEAEKKKKPKKSVVEDAKSQVEKNKELLGG